MNLEIDDYLRTIENVNEKLRSKDSQCEEMKKEAVSMEEKLKSSKDEIGMFEA